MYLKKPLDRNKMAENNRKNGSVPRLGLLKIDGNGSEQNEEARPRSRVNDTDSEYVRMAKTGGHASKFCKLRNHNLFAMSHACSWND